jgi:putative membrane protein
MMWWGGDWSWAAWVAMTLTMLGFWALVIWAVTNFVRTTGPGRGREAEDILAERFARGEINEDEFQHRRELLRGRR